MRMRLPPETRERMKETILSTLRYRGMEDRQGRIRETYKTTFQWILNDNGQTTGTGQSPSLKRWLESPDQVYWISGKAGSGKSTLMKYLCQPVPASPPQGSDQDPSRAQASRCHPYLAKWAENNNVVIASFYFWIADAKGIQKSYAGLLRTLLYQVLRARPDIMPLVFPRRWEALSLFGVHPELSSWTDNQLSSALEVAVEAVTEHRASKICFFLDGLDEFEGKSKDLVSLIHTIAKQGPDIKFCVASRPWVHFQDAFDTEPYLRLEDLNYNDIKFFVKTRMEDDPGFSRLRQREPEFADQLVENIVSKASGVFLWVHIVVASLLSGMGFGDRIEDLQRRLDLLPPDLENLYDRMLRGLDPFYLEHAAQLLLLMEASFQSLPLLVLSFADEENVDSLRRLDRSHLHGDMIDLRLESMERRLNSRWKGLLEVERDTQASPAIRTVQYLHRTVKEFIQTDQVRTFLNSSTKRSFDPHLQLCIAWCAFLKTDYADSSTGEESLFKHAAQVPPANKKVMLEVLDHLEKVRKVSSQPGSTVSAPRARYSHREVVATAAIFNVVAYIDAQLDAEADQSLASDLLVDVVMKATELHASSYWTKEQMQTWPG